MWAKKFDRQLSLTEAQDQRSKARWERNVFGRLLGMQIDVHTFAVELWFGRMWHRRKRENRSHSAFFHEWSCYGLGTFLLLNGFLSLEVFLGDVMAGLTSLRLRQNQAPWQMGIGGGCHWSMAQKSRLNGPRFLHATGTSHPPYLKNPGGTGVSRFAQLPEELSQCYRLCWVPQQLWQRLESILAEANMLTASTLQWKLATSIMRQIYLGFQNGFRIITCNMHVFV